MLSNEAKIEGLTVNVNNMAKDINEIKDMIKQQNENLKEHNKDTREILRTLSMQSERISLLESSHTEGQKKIDDIQRQVEGNKSTILKVEDSFKKFYYKTTAYITCGGSAAVFIFRYLL